MARRADERLAKGEEPGPLVGVPVVLKDNLCTKGVRTTAGSAILGDWKPPYDATVWELLKDAGAVLLGKSNMDEFAMGNTCGSSAFAPPSCDLCHIFVRAVLNLARLARSRYIRPCNGSSPPPDSKENHGFCIFGVAPIVSCRT